MHLIDNLNDAHLHDLLRRVDTTGFPADLQHLWKVERVRYRETLRRIPPATDPSAVLLDLGSSRPLLPFLQVVLGYRRIVLNTCYPDSGFVDESMRVRAAPASHGGRPSSPSPGGPCSAFAPGIVPDGEVEESILFGLMAPHDRDQLAHPHDKHFLVLKGSVRHRVHRANESIELAEDARMLGP